MSVRKTESTPLLPRPGTPQKPSSSIKHKTLKHKINFYLSNFDGQINVNADMIFMGSNGEPVILRQITLNKNEISQFPFIEKETMKLPNGTAIKKSYDPTVKIMSALLDIYKSQDKKIAETRALLHNSSNLYKLPENEEPIEMMGGRRRTLTKHRKHRKSKTLKRSSARK